MLPKRENSFDYGPQRSDESNESYKKRIESALEPPQSPDYGPPKSDEEQQKKAQGKPVEDNVKVININKADKSSSDQLIGEDLSSKIPELETESPEKSKEDDLDLDLQVGGEMTSVDLDELFK